MLDSDAYLITTNCHFDSQVDLSVHPDAEECVKKEICVHKLLKHRNVVGCYGSRCPEMRLNRFLIHILGAKARDSSFSWNI